MNNNYQLVESLPLCDEKGLMINDLPEIEEYLNKAMDSFLFLIASTNGSIDCPSMIRDVNNLFSTVREMIERAKAKYDNGNEDSATAFLRKAHDENLQLLMQKDEELRITREEMYKLANKLLEYQQPA